MIPIGAAISISVKAYLDRLKAIVARIHGGHGAEWTKIKKQWAVRLAAFEKRHFQKASTGGGGWAPLATSTQHTRGKKPRARGRAQVAARQHAILVNTGTLKRALNLGGLGNLNKPLRKGVRYGIGGPGIHRGGKMRIGRLAVIHHAGTATIPARPIIVPPDAKTQAALGRDVQWSLKTTGY